jgi:hypothetical protein
MNIEIEEIKEVYQCGENAGQPSGDKTFTITIDDKEKGSIFYSEYCQKDGLIGAYSAYSIPIFGNQYKSKRFRTFTGAKNFIINGKEKYISLQEAINKVYANT